MGRLLLFILFFNFSLANACVCDYGLEDDIKYSSLILIVEIEKSFDLERADEDIMRSREEIEANAKIWGYHVQVKVLKVYKGTVKNETIEIKSDMFSSCAQDFKIGEKYLVFLSKGKKRNQFLTSVCNHNTLLKADQPYFENLKTYFENN